MAETNNPRNLPEDTCQRRTLLKTNYMGKKYHHYQPNRDKALFMTTIVLSVLLTNVF